MEDDSLWFGRTPRSLRSVQQYRKGHFDHKLKIFEPIFRKTAPRLIIIPSLLNLPSIQIHPSTALISSFWCMSTCNWMKSHLNKLNESSSQVNYSFHFKTYNIFWLVNTTFEEQLFITICEIKSLSLDSCSKALFMTDLYYINHTVAK
jgi:hypothetical protein